MRSYKVQSNLVELDTIDIDDDCLSEEEAEAEAIRQYISWLKDNIEAIKE